MLGIAAITLEVGTALMASWRVRAFTATTRHESAPWSSANARFGVSIIAALATIVGALGVMPDLACAVIGSVLVLVVTASGVAAWVVAHRDRELARHISLAELFVGDRNRFTDTP